MNFARVFLEAGAGVRYRKARLLMPLMRHAFGRIGEGTVVVAPMMLQGIANIFIGDAVLIRDGAWLATEGANSRLDVGAQTYIGHRVHLHALDPISLGTGCVLADNVMISTADHDRGNRHDVHATGPVSIGRDVFIGQNVVVLGGVTIGDGATVAAGAVVVSDVPAGSVVGGVPAKVLGSAL